MAGKLATEVTLDAEAIQGFADGVRGAVLRPGDQGLRSTIFDSASRRYGPFWGGP